ncbi:MAG TPA: hypothetical protein VFD80_07250 [Flavobacteriaceae bacterium]|nr:hypothetical protein [Flavobacteriaceae bacterium]
MKKYLLISLLTVLFISCASDDDAPQDTNTDPIVGSWSPEKHVSIYADGTEVEESISNCEQIDTFEFLANGEFSITLHFDYGSGCEVEINTLEGNWSKIDDSSYAVYGKIFYDGDVTDTETFSITYIVSFPQTNVMYLYDEEYLSYLQEEDEDLVSFYIHLNKN